MACHVGNAIAVQTTKRSTVQQSIKLLIKHFPERATNRDEHGNLPLHYALLCDCDPFFIKELIVLNPSTAYATNSHGLPPMHLCVSCGGGGGNSSAGGIRNQYTLEHLATLHGAAPTAHEVIVFDKTLLHYACKHQQSIAVIKYLLDLNQWWTKIRDHSGKPGNNYALCFELYLCVCVYSSSSP